MSLEPLEETDEQPEGNYLFWALIGAGLVVAIGSHALLGHMKSRPNLAEADPLLMTLLHWTRGIAVGGLVGMIGLLVWQMVGGKK